MATSRDKMKSKRRRSSAKQWADKQESGFERTAYKLPDGWKSFIPKSGKYKVNVVPFKAGAGNPNADEGYDHFERTYFAHPIPGLDGKSRLYCCLAANFGKKCVCASIHKILGPNADQKILDDFKKPKKRQLWIFDVLEGPGEAGKFIFETSYNKGFGELLANKINAVDTYADFSEPTKEQGGMTLLISFGDASFSTPDGSAAKYTACTNIEMIPRNTNYDEDIADEMPCLDDCLIELSYNELVEKLTGEEVESKGKVADDDEDEDDELPAPKKKKPPVDEEDDEEEEDSELEDDDEDDEPPPPKKKSAKELAEEEDDEDEDDSELEEPDDDDDEFDDELDDEDEEDDEPPPRKKKPTPPAKKRR